MGELKEWKCGLNVLVQAVYRVSFGEPECRLANDATVRACVSCLTEPRSRLAAALCRPAAAGSIVPAAQEPGAD